MTRLSGKPVSFTQIQIHDSFWTPRLTANREATLPREYEMCRSTGRIDAFRLAWKPGDQPVPHIFWDSDVAKWVEAASYSLSSHPDPALDALLDDVVALIVAAQQPDGYLNSHYTAVEPENRFTNLSGCHELYCAGHLIEAGVAHYLATGKRMLLQAVSRYADYIGSVFGRGEGQLRGYCGHEEIELALVKLYHVTDQRKYLELSRYFIEERGREPHYFALEAERRGEPGKPEPGDYSYMQAHKPVREQDQVTGHAVRAMYLYSAMADLARELDDPSLFSACERLWEHLSTRQLYLTGGIGASRSNEGFLDDFDLPDASAYCETCAGIGLVFWARRMLQYRRDRKYADVMEKTLYNNVLAGASLDGRKFFYENPLASYASRKNRQGRITAENQYYQRSDWFDCACCPPNYARLLCSLGDYLYTTDDDGLNVHLYMGSTASLQMNGLNVKIEQHTQYPWSGKIRILVDPEQAATFTMHLRIPGWCERYQVRVNGRHWPAGSGLPQTPALTDGYLPVRRNWLPGDELTLELDMPVRRVYAHPDIRYHNNSVAVERGPIVYCAEQADHQVPVRRIYLPVGSDLQMGSCPDLPDGLVCLSGPAMAAAATDGSPLYGARPDFEPCQLYMIPYFAWNNREPGEMRVWLPEYRA